MEAATAIIRRLELSVLKYNSNHQDAPSRVERETQANGHTIRAVATLADCRSIRSSGSLTGKYYSVRWYLDGKVVSRANLVKALEVAA